MVKDDKEVSVDERVYGSMIWTRTVSFDEFKVFLADFNKFDEDHNGALNFDEIKGLLKFQLNREPTEEESVAFFQKLDQEHDGRVILKEYIQNIMGGPYKLAAHTLPPPPPLFIPPAAEEEEAGDE